MLSFINQVTITYTYINSLFIDMCNFHIHRMYGGKDIGGTLHHTLARLRHGNGCACGQKDRLVAAAERQI